MAFSAAKALFSVLRIPHYSSVGAPLLISSSSSLYALSFLCISFSIKLITGHVVDLPLVSDYFIMITIVGTIAAFDSNASVVVQGRCEFMRRGSLRLVKNAKTRVCCSQIRLGDSVDDDETCELVNGVELTLGEDHADRIDAYLLKAVKNNNGTGVLLLSDVLGFEDSATRDFAYRVACNGYNVLVPDLFRGNPWTKDRPSSDFELWRAQHARERVAKDINTSAKWMVEEFLAAGISKKLGIVGFCFGGGRLVETLAYDEGVYFSTGISFYGTRMELSLALSVKVPILFISGDHDPLCPVGPLNEMAKSIGRGSRVLVFKNRGHAFAHLPESPEEDRDAEEAFMAMRNWLHKSLVANEELNASSV
ncbi:hypothetical protein Syun_017663 [Stephania yunnanensis]|uniref:Carboxymethylenebutenolidase homolog n=1 Tax=Stephania yunnanensis TaxID=152371 RepID=A0AAP0J9M1_9MAGN